MKQRFSYLALVALTFTLGSCHQQDELPVTPPDRIERPARISAPFIGQVYTEVQADQSNDALQNSYFLELKDDGTVDYKRYRGDNPNYPEVITGKYTYDPETKKITFSELKSSVTGDKTPEDLYLEDAIYNEVSDMITFRNGKDETDIYFYVVNLKNSVPTEFVGKPYVGRVASQDGKQAVYAITFYPNKSLYGSQTKDGVEQVLSGSYDYDRLSGTFSFANLILGGQSTTAEALGFDKNSSYNATSSVLQLGGQTFIRASQAVTAPFVGRAYAVSYESEDQTIVYRREITFAFDGTFSGINFQNGGETGRFVGTYTYDAKTGALTFANLKAGDSDTTADALYLNQNPRYDSQGFFVLGGSNYLLSSQVPVTQPSNPPAFYNKVYSATWTNNGKTYKESFQLMASGVAHYRLTEDGQVTYGFNGRYTYNATTHAIVFSALLDMDYKIVTDTQIAEYNANAQYLPGQNQFYFLNGYYDAEN